MSWPSDSIVSCEHVKNQTNPGVRGCAFFYISGNPLFLAAGATELPFSVVAQASL